MTYRWKARVNRLLDPYEKVMADLEGLSREQFMFNLWKRDLEEHGDGFAMLGKPIELAWWKCWFWMLLPEVALGASQLKFMGWKIGHCLNCNAKPYDGKIVSWGYGHYWYHGALIKCNQCGQLRWQSGSQGM